MDVPIDPPDQPAFGPHLRRSEEELRRWRKRPYIVTTAVGFEVRCLDGLVRCRPTVWGRASTISEAYDIARREDGEKRAPNLSGDDSDLDF